MRGVSPGARELNLRAVRAHRRQREIERRLRAAQWLKLTSHGGGGGGGASGDQWRGGGGGMCPRLITMTYDKDGRWVGSGVS